MTALAVDVLTAIYAAGGTMRIAAEDRLKVSAPVPVPSRFMLELTGASSGDMRLSDHAARSMI